MQGRAADLHLHTTASDGTDTLDERVADASGKGLDCIAVTDHDTLNPDVSWRSRTIDGVEVISGAEIKAGLNDRKIEILGYFLDPDDGRLQELLDRIDRYRNERMREMIQKTNELVESTITFEAVQAQSDSTIGRPHLARVLVEKGEADSVGEAFEKYIASDREGYVETEKVSAAEVIETIHDNGGVTSLAHPGRSFPRDEALDEARQLKDADLDAIEVPYTYDQLREVSSSTIYFTAGRARRIAEELDLLISGGTDCHGSESSKYFLGDIRLPYRHVERLKDRRQEYV